MKKQLLILFVFLGWLNCNLYAQYMAEGYVAPEAASLGIVSTIPVNHYTGQANISIPLFELQTYDYKLPISLNYNSGGFMPQLMHSWTGQNWDLNAGGVIIRTVKGLPDEEPTYGLYHSLALFKKNQYLPSQLIVYDTEPDEFSFHINGISGKFYLNEDGKFEVIAQPGIQVECNHPRLESIQNEYGKPSLRTFYGFTITTEDGIIYEFGYNDKIIETSNFARSGEEMGNAVATSWHISKIYIPEHKETIHFSYTKKYFDIVKTENESHCYGSFLNTGNYFEPVTNDFYKSGWFGSYSYMNHVYLSSISSSVFNLEFFISKANYSDYLTYTDGLEQQWRKLDSIRLTSKTPFIKIKSVSFNYDEQNGSATRLFLTSIQESGKPPYEFDYYTRSTFSTINPARITYNSREIDHWGYYNAFTKANFHIADRDLTTLVPEEISDDEGKYFEPNREPDPGSCSVGMLKEIKYPTGAIHTFEYESNDYSFFCHYEYTMRQVITLGISKSWSEWKTFSAETNFTLTVNNPIYMYIQIYPISSKYKSSKKKYFLQPGTYTQFPFIENTEIPHGERCDISIRYRELVPNNKAYCGGVRIKKNHPKRKWVGNY